MDGDWTHGGPFQRGCPSIKHTITQTSVKGTSHTIVCLVLLLSTFVCSRTSASCPFYSECQKGLHISDSVLCSWGLPAQHTKPTKSNRTFVSFCVPKQHKKSNTQDNWNIQSTASLAVIVFVMVLTSKQLASDHVSELKLFSEPTTKVTPLGSM